VRSTTLFLAGLLAIAIAVPPAVADAASVSVPKGTKVPIRFTQTISSETAEKGQRVRFVVHDNVVVNRDVVFRRGATVIGMIGDVGKPGQFGTNGNVNIVNVRATATDGKPVKIHNIFIGPEGIRLAKDTGGAAGASIAGAILLGPLGLAAGVLVRGGHVSVKEGTVVVVETD
jgi:hypothetical protein